MKTPAPSIGAGTPPPPCLLPFIPCVGKKFMFSGKILLFGNIYGVLGCTFGVICIEYPKEVRFVQCQTDACVLLLAHWLTLCLTDGQINQGTKRQSIGERASSKSARKQIQPLGLMPAFELFDQLETEKGFRGTN